MSSTAYKTEHWIDGQAFIDKQEHRAPIINPATVEPISSYPIATIQTIHHACEVAEKAFKTWSCTVPAKRVRVFFEFRTLLLTHLDTLAQVITREHGKTLLDAKGSILRAVELIEWYCGFMSHWQTPLTQNVATQMDCYTLREPLGVCVGVSPFNFPVMVPIWMMIPAIACGNTFILKPSEQDPTASVLLCQWLKEAGLPDGVVNVVHGGKEVVEALITDKRVQAVTAVASTPVAEGIYQKAVALNKRSHTFGGAKNHAVVMPDANMQEASRAIAGAAYGSAGERCMALSVVVTVGEETAKRFIEALLPQVENIVIGSGEDAKTEMGPLISAVHRERVIKAITQGVEEGATLLLDGRAYQHPTLTKGYFLGPTLFDNVTPAMEVYQHEIFGPVLVIVRVKTLDEAIALVSENPYGNGTAIFTQSGYNARHYVSSVKVGMVGVNVPIPVPIVSHSFGGWKRSAFGNTPMQGEASLHFYTHLKTVTSQWPKELTQGSAFTMPTHE